MATLYVTAQLGEGRSGLPTAWQLRAVDGTPSTDWSTVGVEEISLEPGAFLITVDVGAEVVGQIAVAGEVDGDWVEMACELFTADDLDPWSIELPGAYAAGTAGAILGALTSFGTVITDVTAAVVLAVQALLTSAYITLTSPMRRGGDIEITPGDDYLAEHGRALQVGYTDAVIDYTDATSTLAISCVGSRAVEWGGTVEVVGTTITPTVQPTATDTAQLRGCRGCRYQWHITLGDGTRITPFRGSVVVVARIGT